MFGGLSRLWLVLLMGSWLMAIGIHDWVMSSHEHQPNAPELSIAQVWNSHVASDSAADHVPMPVVWVCAFLFLCVAVLEQPLQVTPPEVPQVFPRPPDLQQLLFRGPPGRLCQQAKPMNQEMECVENLHIWALPGFGRPSCGQAASAL